MNPFREMLLPLDSKWTFFCLLVPPFRVEAANKIDPRRYSNGWLIVDAEGQVGGPYRFTELEFAEERCEIVNYNAAKRIMVEGTLAKSEL